METDQRQKIRELRKELESLKTKALLQEELSGLKKDLWRSKHYRLADSFNEAKRDTKELGGLIKGYFLWLANNEKGGNKQMETDVKEIAEPEKPTEVKEEAYDSEMDMSLAPAELTI